MEKRGASSTRIISAYQIAVIQRVGRAVVIAETDHGLPRLRRTASIVDQRQKNVDDRPDARIAVARRILTVQNTPPSSERSEDEREMAIRLQHEDTDPIELAHAGYGSTPAKRPTRSVSAAKA